MQYVRTVDGKRAYLIYAVGAAGMVLDVIR
jgi:hypothetical protein